MVLLGEMAIAVPDNRPVFKNARGPYGEMPHLTKCRYCRFMLYTIHVSGDWADDHLRIEHPEIWAKFQTEGTYNDHFDQDDAVECPYNIPRPINSKVV